MRRYIEADIGEGGADLSHKAFHAHAGVTQVSPGITDQRFHRKYTLTKRILWEQDDADWKGSREMSSVSMRRASDRLKRIFFKNALYEVVAMRE